LIEFNHFMRFILLLICFFIHTLSFSKKPHVTLWAPKTYEPIRQKLESSPSITLVQNGDDGTPTSLFIRGTNSNHSTLFWNGLFINDMMSGMGNIGPFLIESNQNIKINTFPLEGPSPSIGGNVMMNDLFLNDSIFMSVHVANAATLNQNIAFNNRFTHGVIQMNASHYETDGSIITSKNAPPNNGQNDLGFESNTLALHGAMTPHLRSHFHYHGKIFKTHNGYFNTFTWAPTNQDTINYLNYMSWQYDHTNQLSTTIYMGLMHQNSDNKAQNGDPTTISNYHGNRVNPGLKIQFTPVAWYESKLYVEPMYERLTTPTPYTRSEFNGGLTHIFKISPQTRIIAYHTLYKSNQTLQSYRLGVHHHLPHDIRFKLGFGTGYRPPTLLQLYMQNQYFYGNPYLKPEKSRQTIVGFDKKWGNTVLLSITYFHYNLHNLIDMNDAHTTLINHPQALTKGLEIANQLTFDHLKIKGGITYNPTKDQSTGLPLYRRPLHKGFLTLSSHDHSWGVAGITFDFIGKRWDIDNQTFNPVVMKKYILTNVSYAYPLNHECQFISRIDNIMDRRFENPNGYIHNGTRFWIGIESKGPKN
jgi:vitamin B12 transporter